MVKDTEREKERETVCLLTPILAKALLASSVFKPGYNSWWLITAKEPSLTPAGAWVMWSGVHNSTTMKQLDEREREKSGMKQWLMATKKQQWALQARDEIFAILPGPWAAGLHSIYMEMSLSLLRWGWRERARERGRGEGEWDQSWSRVHFFVIWDNFRVCKTFTVWCISEWNNIHKEIILPAF